MANTPISMTKLKRMLQLLASGNSQRDVCGLLHMGRNVLSTYVKRALATGKDYKTLSELSDAALSALLKTPRSSSDEDERKARELQDYLPVACEELQRSRHLSVLQLHQEYMQAHPDGYGYTQFKKYVRSYQKSHNYSYHNVYIPGEEMQIDFAGDHLYLTRPKTKEHIAVVVLCCVLPFSGLSYVIALPTASLEHFFWGLSRCYDYLGGVPVTNRSDNMKQWVKRTDRYEPTFNEAALEWSTYYNTELLATRVAHPRDKGCVESLVNQSYRAIYGVIRNEEFHTLNELNNRIFGLMDEYNSKKRGNRESRREVFESMEMHCLQPLPPTPFRFTYRKQVRLGSNYHVIVGSEHHFYSVPYQYVGEEVNVVWDYETVSVYAREERVAIHRRSFVPNAYTTEETHMPEKHQAYKRLRERNAAFYLDKARLIGEATGIVVGRILDADRFPQCKYRSCEGVLSLERKYGRERVEAASGLIKECPSVSYLMLKSILIRKLDGQVVSESVSKSPKCTYVRGAEAFK